MIKFVDSLVAGGRVAFTTSEIIDQLGISPQSASNGLTRLVHDGMLDRVSRGHYAVRQLGLLGTKAAAEDVALAVGVAFSNELHRIAFRSALAHHGMIIHPARTIQVALTRQAQMSALSGRRFQAIVENPLTISVGREPADFGAYVSSPERALLECALRPAISGGWSTLAEALRTNNFDKAQLESMAIELRAQPALRRIASLSEHLGLAVGSWRIRMPKPRTTPIPLDPQEQGEEHWLDQRWRVTWPDDPEIIKGSTFS